MSEVPVPRPRSFVRRLGRLIRTAGVVAALLLTCRNSAVCQVESEELHQLDTERTVVNAIRSLQSHLQQGDEADIRSDLRRLELIAPGELIPHDGVHQPVFRVQLELLYAADAVWRERLRQESRAAADAALRSAAGNGTPSDLLQVVQRYPCSDAACRALQLIARMQIERGHRLAAVWWLQPVTHRHVPEEYRTGARAALDALLQEIREPPPQTLSRVDETSAPGQRSQGAASWSWPVSTSPKLRPGLERIIAGAVAANVVPWTAWHPEVRDDTVYVRTLRGVDAIDLETGRARWNYRLPGSLVSDLEVPGRLLGKDGEPEVLFRQLDVSTITNRMFRDAVSGCLSVDEQHVYVINAAEPDTASIADAGGPVAAIRRSAAASVVELTAVDRASGRPVWVTGGPPVEAMFGNELANAWIFGVPAIHGGRLYCVAEQDDAIVLVCLQAETGQLLWRKFLAFPPARIGQDMVRQYLAATPTVRDGIVWARTTTGWTQAVDLLTRTTLWAARTSDVAVPDSGMPAARRRGMRTTSRSLEQSWRPDTLRVTGDALIVCPHLQHQLRVVDALTGQVRMQRPSRGQVLLLDVVDREGSIILGGPSGVEAWSLETGENLWSTRFPDGVFPTGMGSRAGHDLLLPLSDGRLAAISITTGAISRMSQDAVMTHPCGGVVSIGSDQLIYGPFVVQRVSDTAAPDTTPTLATVQELVATGNFDHALQQLPQVRETVLNRRELKAIRFRCRAMLFRPGDQASDQQLNQLRDDVATATDEAMVRNLEIEHLLAMDKTDEAIAQLADAVQLPETVLNSLVTETVPRIAARQGMPQPKSDAVLHVALRTRVAQQLQELAKEDPDARRQIRDAAAAWDDQQVLTFCGTVFPEMLLRRVESRISSGAMDDQTLRILSSLSRRFRSESDPGETDEPQAQQVRKMWDILHQRVRHSQQQPRLVQHLVETLATESLGEQTWGELATDRNSAADLPDDAAGAGAPDVRQEWARFCQTWAESTFRMIPISQSTSFRRASPALSLIDSSDPFLTSFTWGLHRSMPMLMIEDPLVEGQAPWTIQGGHVATFQSDSGEELLRIGGVVLLMSHQAVTALSIAEQRVLWSRTYATAHSDAPAFRLTTTRLFRDFAQVFRRSRSFVDRGFRVCGFDADQICIQSGGGIEVLELSTGRLSWKLTGMDPADAGFATSTTVFPSLSFAAAGVALNLSNGQLVPSKLTADALRNTVSAVDERVVLWETPDGPVGDVELVWLDPVTAEESHRVRLPDAESFQFIDQYTLAAVASDQTLQVVNLQSGARQVISFAQSEVESADADDAAPGGPPDAGARRPRDFPRWSPERVLVFRDALNYYVVNRRSMTSPPMPRVTGHRLTEVEGQLRAIDRSSGELKWTYDIADVAAVTFDRPLLPMLVLVRMERGERGQAALVQQLHRLSFQAVAKSTGELKFEHRTSSRHPVPVLQIDVHPDRVVDVEAFGSRVRFAPN